MRLSLHTCIRRNGKCSSKYTPRVAAWIPLIGRPYTRVYIKFGCVTSGRLPCEMYASRVSSDNDNVIQTVYQYVKC